MFSFLLFKEPTMGQPLVRETLQMSTINSDIICWKNDELPKMAIYMQIEQFDLE